MKRKSLFNKIISLSIVTALYFSMPASAFAEIEDMSAPAQEAVTEDVEHASSPEGPAEGTENTSDTQEGKETVQETTGGTSGIIDEIIGAVKDVIGATPEDETPQLDKTPVQAEDDEASESDSNEVDEASESPVVKEPEEGDTYFEIVTKEDGTTVKVTYEYVVNEETGELEAVVKEELEGLFDEEGNLIEKECEHELVYTSNKDGTHTVTCSKCDMDEYTESCVFDEEGVCIYCGWKRLPDPILVYEDDEVIVKVSGAVPENADLKVTPLKKTVEETMEAFAQVERKLIDKTDIADHDAYGLLAYDICFIKIDTGEEVEPSDNVTVSMEYKKQINPLGEENKDKIENVDVSLVHISDEDSSIEKLSEDNKAVLELDGDKALKKAEFTNDTFSPYVFIYTGNFESNELLNVYFNSINRDGDNLVTIQNEESKDLIVSREGNQSDPVINFKDDIPGYRFVEAGYMVDGNMVIFDNFRYTFRRETRYSWTGSYYEYYPSLQFYLGDTKVVNEGIEFAEDKQVIVYMFYEKDVTLSISKIATGPPASDPTTEYEFRLITSGGNPVESASFQKYSKVDEEIVSVDASTDSNGKFTLKAGESADFSIFAAGDYIVTELGVINTSTTEPGEEATGYSINDFKTKIFVDGEQKAEYAPESIATRQASFTTKEGELTEVKIKNYYYTKTIESQKEAVAAKYVRYNSNDDNYQVQVKFTGPEIVKKETSYEKETQDTMKAKEVHVIFAVDRSNSMGDNKRAVHMQRASKTMAEIIKTKKHVNAQWKIVDFGSQVETTADWLTTDDFYDQVKTNSFAWYYPAVWDQGGTNYEGALQAIKNIINADTSDAQKVVIFLTDGLPTFWIGGGSYGSFSSTAYTKAVDMAKTVGGDAFYSVGLDFSNSNYNYNGVNRKAEWLLTNMTNQTQATTKKTSTVTGDKLVDLFKSLAGVISATETGDKIETVAAYHAQDVLINDPLSDYVDIQDGTTIYIGIRDENIPVSADDPNANELQNLGRGKWRNGTIDSDGPVVNNHDDTSINIAEYDIYETDENGNTHTYTVAAYYDYESRSVKMTYPEGYELPPNYSFAVSFIVAPSEKAIAEYYDNLRNGNELYNAVGDPFTDHGDIPEEQWTSTGKPGFYSNGDAKASYEFCGNHVDDPFPHPVIQVHLINEWEIYKTDEVGEAGIRLKDAQFELNQVGSDVSYSGRSSFEQDKEGIIVWSDAVEANNEYVLKETNAPIGYVKNGEFWKIQLDGENIPTVTVCSADGSTETAYEVEPTRNGKVVTYKFYFKNFPMDEHYGLPQTGGSGTHFLTGMGIMMIMTSAFLFYRNKKKSKAFCKYR